jgi:hydrogenase-4 component B
VSLILVIGAIVILAFSGLPALFARNATGERTSTALALGGASMGLAGAGAVLRTGIAMHRTFVWEIPGGALALRIDALSAAFLLPIFTLGALAAIYGLGYWPASEHRSSGRVRAFSGVLIAAMAGVVVAWHALLFLVAWEAMALAAFFLIAAEDEQTEVRRAAWIYLIATHVGTIALTAMFVLMRAMRGTFALGQMQDAGALAATAVFVLALFGFGFKAGIVPLHFWLPGAHANAPSHVSALLSGAMLKVGIYGLLRTILLLPPPPAAWGLILMAIGAGSALVGVVLAIAQADLKRALAYSSIENIGIIVTAIGLAILGRALGQPVWTAFGIAAAIAHVWSHSLFKGLLFLSAGSVLHATGTRRIDALGGLVHRMPTTSTAFVIGAAAASALPGAVGFISEALLYMGLISAAQSGSSAGLAAALIALAGALAVACFVRLTGIAFLGQPRTAEAAGAHEGAWTMRLPLIVLGCACIVLGIWPGAIAAPLRTIVGSSAVDLFLRSLAMPLQIAGAGSALLSVLLIASTRRSPRRLTWDCGYAAPSARMQYTARSFGEWLNEHLSPRFFQPAVRATLPRDLYPENASFETEIDEPFTARIYEPFVQRWTARFMRLRWMQQGRLTVYVLYIVITLVAFVAWSVLAPIVEAWL